MARKKPPAGPEPVYNASGTHVYTTSPTGDEWECPADYLPVALARGFTLSSAPVQPDLDTFSGRQELLADAAEALGPGLTDPAEPDPENTTTDGD